MHVHRYEAAWIRLTIAMLVVFFCAVMTAAIAGGIQLPSPQGYVDPKDLSGTDFDPPGLRQLSTGHYEVYMVGQIWRWEPNEIRIPEGSHLTMYLTSRDVQHGFNVIGTNINVMVIPGQVSRVEHHFEKPGEYWMICHEYCGLNHQTMSGSIIVEAAAEETQ
ncbi:MAG: cytochrome c oxidase subunit II [Chloroflexi bacterium]|nr:cytochrome c oxidase subunit II [Chloroflexota bacterium]